MDRANDPRAAQLEDAAGLIRSKRVIALGVHERPDLDCLGSMLALAHVLEGLEKRVTLLSEDGVNGNAFFLPGIDRVVSPRETQAVELFIALDCATRERLGSHVGAWFGAAADTLCIDHHPSNRRYARHNIVWGEASSTGEMIYRLIGAMGAKLDARIATCLFVAISADTGHFSYTNTHPATLRTAADLLEYDLPIDELTDIMYRKRSLLWTRMIGEAIGRLRLYDGGRIAGLSVSLEDMGRWGASDADCEGLVDYARQIDGVEVGFFIREMGGGTYRCNLRSRRIVDANRVAARFGGGGHTRAAGCSLRAESLDRACDAIAGALIESLRAHGQ